MNIPNKTKDNRIDEIVEMGKLWLLNNNNLKMPDRTDTYRDKIKAYREELKQLFEGS